jgi:hypothetical protein
MKVIASKIKKFDIIELVCGTHTVDYLLMYKGSNYCRIFYMNGRSTFCLTNEEIEVKRDKFYSLNHKIFTTSILNVYQ